MHKKSKRFKFGLLSLLEIQNRIFPWW